jgi:hypothetical protein
MDKYAWRLAKIHTFPCFVDKQCGPDKYGYQPYDPCGLIAFKHCQESGQSNAGFRR